MSVCGGGGAEASERPGKCSKRPSLVSIKTKTPAALQMIFDSRNNIYREEAIKCNSVRFYRDCGVLILERGEEFYEFVSLLCVCVVFFRQ